MFDELLGFGTEVLFSTVLHLVEKNDAVHHLLLRHIGSFVKDEFEVGERSLLRVLEKHASLMVAQLLLLNDIVIQALRFVDLHILLLSLLIKHPWSHI